MTLEEFPICVLKGDAHIDHLVAIDLPANMYTLDELRTIVRVLEKYKAMVRLVDAPTVGGMQ